MSQSAILKHAYNTLFSFLKETGKASGLFTAEDNIPSFDFSVLNTVIYLTVTDICQMVQDKTGQRIVVDEKMYELPSLVGLLFAINIIGKTYNSVLETAGNIISALKDKNIFDAGEYSWHGNSENKIFFEPVIRNITGSKYTAPGAMPSLVLEYRLDAGINSLRGKEFKRVEKREVRGVIKDQDK